MSANGGSLWKAVSSLSDAASQVPPKSGQTPDKGRDSAGKKLAKVSRRLGSANLLANMT